MTATYHFDCGHLDQMHDFSEEGRDGTVVQPQSKVLTRAPLCNFAALGHAAGDRSASTGEDDNLTQVTVSRGGGYP